MFQRGSYPNLHVALAEPDGSVFQSLDVDGVSGNTWQGDSAALLMVDGQAKKYEVLRKDGIIVPIPAALTSAIDPRSPNAFGQAMGDPILVDDHTLLGIEGIGNSKYVILDLQSGQQTTLLTVTPTTQTGGIQPASINQLGLSTDHKVARVLIRHATVNGTAVPQWAVVEIELARLAVSSINQLPVQAGVDSYGAFETAISPDGRLIAYQENQKVNAQNIALYTTHIVDLASGRNTAIVDRSIQCSVNSRCLRFSPDGTALMAYGGLAPEFGSNASLMGVFDTSDGHLLWRQNVGSEISTIITPWGWAGSHTLVYSTTTTTLPGNFTNGVLRAHTLETATGKQVDLPEGLGYLVAVLN